ncbi:DUF3311 domain-containing protein [Humibacter sp. RRB41]|uniref:DUF3311 domain-containing protein n=1 Tax=Humibacter sp. RRB41 TaxID=2919946 RepID=UPI001FAA4618|nr:DUF3311 domain-containing protein [Humibacter sp. RRB41]
MSDPDIPTRGPARPGPYVISGILIAIAIVMPLIVPLYAFTEPTFWGMPFFYWYQLLWVFIAAGLLGIAYLIMRKEDRRRRAVVRGRASTPASNDVRDSSTDDEEDVR